MRFRSRDGLLSSNDPEAVDLWEKIADDHARMDERARSLLPWLGVKMAHPDDGWVDREKDVLKPCYPLLDRHPVKGDLIALGWPFSGYRLVRVTSRTEQRGFFGLVTVRLAFGPEVAYVQAEAFGGATPQSQTTKRKKDRT